MSRKKKKEIYPGEWPWPFSSILWFFKYKGWVNELEPEDIGRLRRNIEQHGFNGGCQVFDVYITGQLASRYYEKKNALQDVADGYAPGQRKKEYDEERTRKLQLEHERAVKRRMLDELQQEIKNAEVDRVNIEDIRSSIDKVKKFGGKS